MEAEQPAMDQPCGVVPSEKERAAGAYSPRNLRKVLEALHRDGLVALKDVIDVEHINAMNKAMCEEAENIMADPNKAYNHNIRSNFLQRPPVAQPAHLHADIYFNKFLLQVANAYLGHKPIWNWLTSNTALANTAGVRQPVHKDSDWDHPKYPYYFIANIPLCDFSADNGSTEFWLGSHAHADVSEQACDEGGNRLCFISVDAREARRAIRPPVQPQAKRGDIMIRDLRLWHAGMPNTTSEHRIMLGLGYQSPSHANYKMRCHLPESQQGFFLSHARDLVEVRANFYPDEELTKSNPDEYFSLRPSYEETD